MMRSPWAAGICLILIGCAGTVVDVSGPRASASAVITRGETSHRVGVNPRGEDTVLTYDATTCVIAGRISTRVTVKGDVLYVELGTMRVVLDDTDLRCRDGAIDVRLDLKRGEYAGRTVIIDGTTGDVNVKP